MQDEVNEKVVSLAIKTSIQIKRKQFEKMIDTIDTI